MQRVLVTGSAGAGKSTFSRHLGERTGLPVILLDVAFWQPGWTEPSDAAWVGIQRELLAGDCWILDGNYTETLALRLTRADTIFVLDMPWWLCSWRALVRGVRSRAPGFVLPDGCVETRALRWRAEWRLALLIWRNHRSDTERERAIIAEHGAHVDVIVLRSRREVDAFLARV